MRFLHFFTLVAALSCAPLLPATAHSQVYSLPHELDQDFKVPAPVTCSPQLRLKPVEKKVLTEELSYLSLKDLQDKLEEAMIRNRGEYLKHSQCTPKSHGLRQYEDQLVQKLNQTRRWVRGYKRWFQQTRRCLFGLQLSRLEQRETQPQNKRILKILGKISKRIEGSHVHRLARLRAWHLGQFKDIYTHFWKKKQLDTRSCQALSQSYRVWSSFNHAVNLANRALPAHGEKIPMYTANGHNQSYVHWAWEYQKGRIPRGGLALLHPDSHPDMGGYTDSRDAHWTNKVLTLKQINLLLSHKQPAAFRKALRRMIRSAKGISSMRKRALLSVMGERSMAQLQRQLHKVIPKRVMDIAHPVTAATFSGITNKLLLCMPPWSHRMDPSPIRKGKSQPLFLTLVRSKDQEIQFGVDKSNPHPLLRSDMPPFLLFSPKDRSFQDLKYRVPFHMTICNNEQYDVDKGKVRISHRDEKLPPLSSYFSRAEKKKGFLLGIDLDVFSTDGAENDLYVIPRSYARTLKKKRASAARKSKVARCHKRGHKKGHKSHGHSHNAKPKSSISAQEYRLVKSRVKDFFARLARAKRDGYLPRVITIADSTPLERGLLAGAHFDDLGGGEYVPGCLAFLLNFHVKMELAKLYKNRLLFGTSQMFSETRRRPSPFQKKAVR